MKVMLLLLVFLSAIVLTYFGVTYWNGESAWQTPTISRELGIDTVSILHFLNGVVVVIFNMLLMSTLLAGINFDRIRKHTSTFIVMLVTYYTLWVFWVLLAGIFNDSWFGRISMLMQVWPFVQITKIMYTAIVYSQSSRHLSGVYLLPSKKGYVLHLSQNVSSTGFLDSQGRPAAELDAAVFKGIQAKRNAILFALYHRFEVE